MPSVPLLDLDDPVVAAAAADVLVRSGVPATVDTDGVTVLVPAGRRDEAMAALASRLDEVAQARAVTAQATVPAPPDPDDLHTGPPLFMSRLASQGLLVILLVPLLAVTLASPGMPRWLGGLVVLAGIVALGTARWGRRR